MEAQGTAQAEARASLWVPAKPEHAKLGWTYDFEQTERIARAAYDSTGYGAAMEVVEFVMAEADRRHADALVAKDAELAAERAALRLAADRADRAEAQLAEARKALANYDRWLNGRDAYIVQKGLWQNFVASLPGSPTAHRVLEAHGGE